jgi:hypothetical protein
MFKIPVVYRCHSAAACLVDQWPRDNVIIWDDGSVSDARDEVIGNIYDEISREA